MMMKLLSQREYARRRGWSPSYVNKLVKRGVILLVDNKIDPEAADASIAAASDPAKSYMSDVNKTQRARYRGGSSRKSSESKPIEHEQVSVTDSYQKARTAREHYMARLAKLDYEERSGKLVNADEVKVAAFNCARKARDALIAIPDRVAPILAGESDSHEVHRILSAEIRQVCVELSGGRGEQPLQ